MINENSQLLDKKPFLSNPYADKKHYKYANGNGYYSNAIGNASIEVFSYAFIGLTAGIFVRKIADLDADVLGYGAAAGALFAVARLLWAYSRCQKLERNKSAEERAIPAPGSDRARAWNAYHNHHEIPGSLTAGLIGIGGVGTLLTLAVSFMTGVNTDHYARNLEIGYMVGAALGALIIAANYRSDAPTVDGNKATGYPISTKHQKSQGNGGSHAPGPMDLLLSCFCPT